MVGLIKLTSVGNDPFFINPLHITFFTPSTPELCNSICGNADACVPGATTMLIGSLPLQMKDSPKEIISALIRLRDAQNNAAIKLLKDRTKEDWQSDTDMEEDDES
jgi:hypothetical protein